MMGQTELRNPAVVFLKQAVTAGDYFFELGCDLSQQLGPCLMFAGVPADQRHGNLMLCAAPPYRNDSPASRIKTWLLYVAKAFQFVFRVQGHPLLFIVAQPPFLPALGYIFHRLRGLHYVVWVDDVYPDVLVRFGYVKEKGLIANLWRSFNRAMYRHADCVFTLGYCMADTIRPYVTGRDGRSTRMDIVPTWVDPDTFHPIPKEENRFAREQEQVGKLTLLYSGNIGESHDVSVILEGARRLASQPDINFMVISGSPRAKEMAAIAQAEGRSNLRVLPPQPREVLPYSLATADVAMVALGRGAEGISMPSKTYYGMAVGSALLGISHPPNDLADVIARYECGVNIIPGDADSFVAAVLRFREDAAYLQQCQANARDAAVKVFSRSVNTDKVLSALGFGS